MATHTKALTGAIALSLLLHAAALLLTARFAATWTYEEAEPAVLEVQLVSPPRPRAAAPMRPLPTAQRRRAAPKPAPAPAPLHAASGAVELVAPPSPDGEPLASAAAVAHAAPSAAPASPAAARSAPIADSDIETAVAAYPLKEARLVFDLYYGHNPTKVGQVTHRWTQDGEHYSVESVAEAVGFISFFFGGRFVQRSVGHLTKTGLLPDQYTLERGRGDKPEVVRFDWEEQKLALAWKDESRLLDLPAGAQDPLSILHQLYFHQPLPASARLEIATSRKLSRYVYRRVGEQELLETPLGMLTTLHFRRQEPDGTVMDVWLDQHRNLLPARIHLVDRKGRVLDQVIREARIEVAP